MPNAERTHWKILCLTGMAIGIALVAAGSLWNALAKPEHVWSNEQASEFETARNAMHELTYDLPRTPASPDNSADSREAQMAAAKRRFEKIEADLAAARSRQQLTGVWMTRMGLAALVLFGLGYLTSHGS